MATTSRDRRLQPDWKDGTPTRHRSGARTVGPPYPRTQDVRPAAVLHLPPRAPPSWDGRMSPEHSVGPLALRENNFFIILYSAIVNLNVYPKKMETIVELPKCSRFTWQRSRSRVAGMGNP